MRILQFLDHRNVVELDVQVLIHALQSASDGDVILELDSDLMIHQRLEEAEEQHFGVTASMGVCYRAGRGMSGGVWWFQGSATAYGSVCAR